jgi:hypothetical protein
MQDWRFDDLTRTLGKATSRRQVLKGLIGGALGLAAVSQSTKRPAAAAGCQNPDAGGTITECRKYAVNAYSECRAEGQSLFSCLISANVAYDLCRAPLICPSGQMCCQPHGLNECIDVQADRNNCGYCFNVCDDPSMTCQAGHCTCPAGQEQCTTYTLTMFAGVQTSTTCCPPGTHCEDDQSTRAHCAKNCDPPCNECQYCLGETCHPILYPNNAPCGDGNVCCNGQCIDTQTDSKNCGNCRHACAEGQECCNGQCVDPCPSGQPRDPETCQCGCVSGTPCGDECCSAGQECCNGQCLDPCPSGKSRDPETCQCNCASGTPCGDTCCSDTQTCCNGQCVDACPSGQHLDTGTCQCTACESGDPCGPYCCSADKVCCPDSLSGMSCRDPQGNCGCGVPCGGMCCGQYEFCCRAADYSYHCVASSGDTC